MAADLTTVRKMVTEILNASQAGVFSATLDTNNKDRVAAAIDESIRYGAFMIAKAVASNPNHPHRPVFMSDVPYGVTHGAELPDMAGPHDTIEIQKYAGEIYQPGIPRTMQEVLAYRTNTLNIYGSLAHNAQYSPRAGYYAISNGRIYFTGQSARVFKPVIDRNATLGQAGTAQIEKITIANACSSDGNATVTITAEGMPNSPVAVTVGVSTLAHSTAELVAAQIAADLNSDPDVGSWFTATDSGTDVNLTAKQAAAEDTTMDITVNAAGTGIGSGSGSTTTPGVAPDVAGLIPNEYEPAWVALGVGGFSLKEGDNMLPICQYYLQLGMSDLTSIANASGVLESVSVVERAIEARGDV